MYLGFENISISFDKKEIIKDLTLEIPKGKIVTMIGRNGCGKSSLIKTIFKVFKQDKGEVIFDGQPITKYNSKYLAKMIGYLPQVHSSPPDIDVYTLASYGRFPYMKFGSSLSKKDRQIINQALRFTGLESLKHQRVGTLSGGELQRAWLSMVISQEPSILVLDEPTTYLDISHQIETLELVKRLNNELGITVVMVLHDINLAVRYSDEVVIIDKKNIYDQGAPEEVITKKVFNDVFDLNVSIKHDEDNDCKYFVPITTK